MSERVQSDAAIPPRADGDDGYMLLGLIVAIAVLLLWLGAAAADVAFSIRRDREVETARRADQYVRAIRLYYKKFGHYPGSVEQLEKTNNIRFLRQRWVDPLTGTDDWRTIAVRKNLTTPRGFFGAPLAGLPTTGLGGPAGSGMPGSPTSPGAAGPGTGAAPGTAGAPTAASPANGPPFGLALSTQSPGTPGAPGTATPAAGAGSAQAPSATSSGSPAGGPGAPTGVFMGVGVSATGNSILEINEQTTYQTWEFLYDPRVEQLRVAQQLNSGVQSGSPGSTGQLPTATPPDANSPGGPASPPNSGTPSPLPSPPPFIGAPNRP